MTSCWLRLTQPANVTRSRCHDRSPLMSTILSAGWPLATSVLHKTYVRLNQWTLRVRLCLGLILLPFWFHSKAHFRGGNRHSKCETEYKRLFLRIIMQRRGRDSNPRYNLTCTLVFETSPFSHSGTSPTLPGGWEPVGSLQRFCSVLPAKRYPARLSASASPARCAVSPRKQRQCPASSCQIRFVASPSPCL